MIPDSEEIEKFERHVNALLSLTEEILKNPIRYSFDEDHFGFMVLCFTTKQYDHLRSISVLIKAGLPRDAAILARVMMEGMVALLWVVKNGGNEFSRQWRAYSLISDFRRMQKKKADGEDIDPSVEKKLIKGLDKEGEQFFSKKALKSNKEGTELPHDPYRKRWLDKMVPEIFSEIGQDILYEQYSYYSDWVHWNPQGLGRALQTKENITRFRSKAPEEEAGSFACGFMAVYETLNLLIKHFKLDNESDLKKIRDDYVSDFEKN